MKKQTKLPGFVPAPVAEIERSTETEDLVMEAMQTFNLICPRIGAEVREGLSLSCVYHAHREGKRAGS